MNAKPKQFIFTRAHDYPLPNIQEVCVRRLALLEFIPLSCQMPDNPDVIIAVSVPAARFGLRRYVQIHGLPCADVIGVGQATASAFADFGIHATSPLSQNAQAVLQMPLVQNLPKAARVQIWRGEKGLDTLQNGLLSQNICVQVCKLYRRVLPQNAKHDFAAINPQSGDFVLISSLSTWQNWCLLCQDTGKNPKDFVYLVLGSRIFTSIAMPYKIQIDDLTTPTLARALTSLNTAS